VSVCDASAFPRLTLKGAQAETFLRDSGVDVPARLFEVRALTGGGIVARTGTAEFFCEDGVADRTVARLESTLLAAPAKVYRAVRQDASFLLGGSAVNQLLLQTCGVDFPSLGPDLVFSRVAGVSCAILKRTLNQKPVYQLWLDHSYGSYLWENLIEIASDLGGGPVGLGGFFPQLTPRPLTTTP
nr:hypothetical protein [Planctomycetota bacterium]